MTMIEIELKGNMFTIDSNLKAELDFMKKEVKFDWDFITLCDGMEGSGKTTIITQCAYYLSEGNLTIDNFCFTADEFEKRIKAAKQNDVIIYDEAVTGLDIKDTMTTIAKGLKRIITQIRYKNLFIFVILPSFFDFQKYWAIHRSDLLIHVYTQKANDHIKRGYFRAYSRENKKYLFINGKIFYNYNVQKNDFNGTFNSFFPNSNELNSEAYKEKKKMIVEKADEEADKVRDKRDKPTRFKLALIKMVRKDIIDRLRTYQEIEKITLIPKSSVHTWVNTEDDDLDKFLSVNIY